MRVLNETFSVQDGFLIRSVVPQRGQPYQHSCPLDTLKAVAHAVDERADQPLTLSILMPAVGQPDTQVNVAFGFMKERGILMPVFGRKHKRATGDAYIDAMTEYHALAWRQEHPGEPT